MMCMYVPIIYSIFYSIYYMLYIKNPYVKSPGLNGMRWSVGGERRLDALKRHPAAQRMPSIARHRPGCGAGPLGGASPLRRRPAK